MTDGSIDERRARLRRALVKAGRDERASSALHASLATIAASHVATSSATAAGASSPSLAASAVTTVTTDATGAAIGATTTGASAAASSGGSATAGISKVAAASSFAMWKVAATGLVLTTMVVASAYFSLHSSTPRSGPEGVAPAATATSEPASTPMPLPAELATVSVDQLPGAELPAPAIEPGTKVTHEERRRSKAASPIASIAPSLGATAPSAAPSVDAFASVRTESSANLADEMKRVEAIRSASNAGHPGEALRLLEQYRADFPSGMLSEETEVLRIESLSRLGRVQAATQLATRFVKEHPRSPYTARVQTILTRLSETPTQAE